MGFPLLNLGSNLKHIAHIMHAGFPPFSLVHCSTKKKKNDCIVWLLLEDGVTNCRKSWETNGSFLMLNIHMKENSCYMSLGQGQASNTLDRKGNHICFYGYRLFPLSSTFTSVTLRTCEFPTARTHSTTHVELVDCDESKLKKLLKHRGCCVLKSASPWVTGEEKVGLD